MVRFSIYKNNIGASPLGSYKKVHFDCEASLGAFKSRLSSKLKRTLCHYCIEKQIHIWQLISCQCNSVNKRFIFFALLYVTNNKN
jgi:hypothetical protein